MRFITKNRKPGFVSGLAGESETQIANPGRGWYRIYTYSLGDGPNCDLPPVLTPGETLALVMLDIGTYREERIPDAELDKAERIFAAFAKAGVEIILRIVYDSQGKGMEREPSFFSLVLTHIEQFAPILMRHADDIFLMQGVFVGSWGEMHSSKFLTPDYLRRLYDAICRATQGKIRLAFRRPAQLRCCVGRENVETCGIGIFDDACLGDETDLGTFGIESEQSGDWEMPWGAENEFAFLQKLSKQTPIGGEVIAGQSFSDAKEMDMQLRKRALTYLNCIHDGERIAQFQSIALKDGESLYDAIGKKLGYRLVARKVRVGIRGSKCLVGLTIENVGYAAPADPIRATFYLGNREPMCFQTTLGGLEGNAQTELNVELPVSPMAGESLLVVLEKERGNRPIQLANGEAKQMLCLGRFA